MIAFLGQIKIIVVELNRFIWGSTNYSRKEINACKEMHLMSGTMFAPYAVSQDIMNNIVM